MGNLFARLSQIICRWVFQPINNYLFRPIYRLACFIPKIIFPPKKPHDQYHNPNAAPSPPPELNIQEEEPAETNMSPEDKQFQEQHCMTINQLAVKSPLAQEDLDELAHTYAQLAFLYSKYGNSEYENCLKSVKNIYDASLSQYYEDKIILLNNIALNLDSHKQQAKSVHLYEEALNIAETYLPLADHRIIVLKNNLALACIGIGQEEKGREILNSCSRIIARRQQVDPNLNELIDSNLTFHKGKMISAEVEEARAVRLTDEE